MRLQQAKPQDQQKPKVDQQGQHKRGQPEAHFAPLPPHARPILRHQRRQNGRKSAPAQSDKWPEKCAASRFYPLTRRRSAHSHIGMTHTMAKSLLVCFFFISSAILSIASPYEGVYRGTVSLSENYYYYGFDGIFVGHIDSKSQATLWVGNSEEAYKFSFKVNSNGQGQFKADGIKVTINFSTDGSIWASTNTDRELAFESTKVPSSDRIGASQTSELFRKKLKSTIDLNFPSNYEAIDDASVETLRDSLLLMSGVWQIKSAKVVIDGIGRVTMSGDTIILPDSIYTFSKAKGIQILVQQDPFSSDYSTIQLTSGTLNWPKKQLSAQGSAYVQGYYGTVSIALQQKSSFYDSDGDGLSNHAEVNNVKVRTDPFKADTDGDKVGDGEELAAGTDPLNRSEFPAKLTIAISTAKGNAQIPSMATVAVNGVNHEVPLTKGKGTKVLSLPSGKSYEISASSANWTSGTPQQISLKKTTTLRVQLKPTS
jgi:hypothetical protein